jgi:hypothetical protein
MSRKGRWPSLSVSILNFHVLMDSVQVVKEFSYLFALASLIALMMEAAPTSETSVDIDLTTRQYIPEDSALQR